LATLASPGVSATARSRPDVTDHDLVQAVRAGDDHAFERLYHRYHRRISAYIFGMVHDHGRAEDLTQEVFVSALRRMRQTDRPIAFKPWVYEIAKNACIDQFRRTSRTEEVSIDAEDGGGLTPGDHGKLHARGLSPDAAVESKQQLADLQGAFGGLSDAHHQILVMRELEGLSYREIGERLGMSRPSVESTLFRARRRLTEEYEELRTGERCLRIQEIIGTASAGAGRLGTRDQRRVGSHISYCQPCRKDAVMAGLDAAVLARRPVRARIAAFLPLPAFLKKRWLEGGGGAGPGSSDVVAAHAPALTQASMVAAQYGDSTMAGWVKASAVAAAVALAGVGTADRVVGGGGGKHHDAPVVQSAAPAAVGASSPASSASRATGGARQASAVVHKAGSGGAASRRSSTGRAGSAAAGSSTGSAGNQFSGATGSTPASGGSTGGGGGGSKSASSSSSAKDASTSSAASGSGSGSASHTTTTSTPITSGPVQQAAGSAGSATSGATTPSQPLVQPDLGALTQPASTPPPSTAGGVVSGATDVVGNTVGGQLGDTVKGTGQAVGNTVDQVTQGVTGAVGTLLGGGKGK
jgi:RNA polymerase sigma factor (sigma-70 family)